MLGRDVLGIRRGPIGESVATYIRSLIVVGELQMGEFVRMERIAQDLGVSVTPVREALLNLRSEGLVSLEPNRGFVVAAFDADDIHDLFLMRGMVASELAVRAAHRIRPAELATLTEQFDRWEADVAARDLDRIAANSREFQRIVNEIAASPALHRYYDLFSPCTTYSALVMDGIQMSEGSSRDGAAPSMMRAIVETVSRYERELLEAFVAKDASAAALAATSFGERLGRLVASNLVRRRSGSGAPRP